MTPAFYTVHGHARYTEDQVAAAQHHPRGDDDTAESA